MIVTTGDLGARQAILHYDETTGFNHGTRSVSLALFNSIANNNGYTVTQDSDGNGFTQANLDNFDLVVFSNTSGDGGLTASQRAALEWFVDSKGGSLMGIHAATDTYRHSSANGGSTGTWDWYAETLGGSVQQSPNHTSANHVNDINLINSHPAAANISFPWNKEEEYYYWENGYLNPDINEILRVDQTGGNSYDAARPVAWSRTAPSGAKIFYTSLGHKTGNFTGNFPTFETLIENAAQWLVTSDPLGVELSSLDARPNYDNASIELRWATSSETNNNFFEVQFSIDGEHWIALSQVNSQGASQTKKDYFFEHSTPIRGKNIYRLRQVDFDGSTWMSEQIEVDYSAFQPSLVYPNPAMGITTLSLGSRIESGEVTLVDLNGRELGNWSVSNARQLEFDVSKFTPGIYLIQIASGNGEAPERVKLLVQN